MVAKVLLRAVLVTPLAPVVLILGLSIVGIPLALLLMHFIGKFVTKPFMDDPKFKVDPQLEGYDVAWHETIFEGE